MTVLAVLALALGVALWIAAFLVFFRYVFRRSVVARAPLAPSTRIELPLAGKLVLYVERPRFGRVVLKPAGAVRLFGTPVAASARELATGAEIVPKGTLVGATVKGVGRIRVATWTLKVERAGAYELKIEGLPDQETLSECELVVTRPMLGAVLLFIAMLILAAGLSATGGILLSSSSAEEVSRRENVRSMEQAMARSGQNIGLSIGIPSDTRPASTRVERSNTMC